MSSFPRTRRHPRIESVHPCFIERIGDDPLEIFSRTRTIGTGGCCFDSETALGFRSLTKVSLSVAGRTMSADGRVVYERPHGNGLEIGIEFIRLDPKDRIHLREVIQTTGH